MKKFIIKYPLLSIVFLAILLRLPLLNSSFWMDEAAQALEVVRPFNQQLNIVADFQPPLLHLILHFAQYVSQSEWFLRTIGAVIPGIISLIYTYKIAEQLFSKKVAILTGILLATSSFHIFFSQELRPYALPTALAMLSLYHLLEAVNSNFLTKLIAKNEDNLVFVTVFNALGLYSSYLYPFFMIAQIGYVLYKFKLKESKKILASFAISIVSFFPFLPIFLQQLKEGGNVREGLPGWDQVVSISQLKAIPLVFGKLLFGVLPLDLNPILIVLGILLCFTTIGAGIEFFKTFKKQNLNLFFFWLAVPLITAWVVSFIVPVIQPKRLLFLLPGIYIFISSISIFSIENCFKKGFAKISLTGKSTILFVTTILLINILGTLGYYTQPKLQREDWRTLQQQLHKDFKPSETLLVYSFPDQFAPMQWYERTNTDAFPYYATKALYIDSVEDLSNSIKIVANYKVILVFDYLRDLTDPERKIEQHLIELGFKEVGVLDYPNIGFVRIFMQPTTVIGMK